MKKSTLNAITTFFPFGMLPIISIIIVISSNSTIMKVGLIMALSISPIQGFVFLFRKKVFFKQWLSKKQKIIHGIIWIVFGIVLIFLSLPTLKSVKGNNDFTSVYKKEIKAGNELIRRIEDYRIKNDELPEKLNLVYSESEKEKYDIYYYDIEDQDYVLYFGTSLGEGVYYFSKYKEWCDYLKY